MQQDDAPRSQDPFLADLIEAEGGNALAQSNDWLDEARCRSLLRVLTSVLWLSDALGNFVSPQPSWQAYTGQERSEYSGHGWLCMVHPEDRDAVWNALLSARATKQLFQASGRVWHARTQSWHYCDARGVPVLGPDGEIAEWIGTCRDVDARRRAEDALQEADQRKDAFIATLAHELRNPLAPIRNAAHILKQRGNDDLQLSWARDIIERQITQMSRFLDDLLDASRIKQNKISLTRTRVTLDSILDQAVEVSRPVLEQNGHHFELNVLAGPVHLDADAGRLVQAFSNLLNNAAKYTDPGGRVSLTLRMEDTRTALVSIRDTGIGIAPEMLTRIFDTFSQVDTRPERAQRGLGIGLALVKSLVELHDGTVEARSDGLGRGSEFIVRLPASMRRGQAERFAAPPAGRDALRVLVADANADAAETLAVIVRMAGHQALAVTNGQSAPAQAADFDPHVALIDPTAPKLEGWQLAQRLRSSRADVLLVAMTTGAGPQHARDAHAPGFDHQLRKPVDPEQIATLLQEAARGRSALASNS